MKLKRDNREDKLPRWAMALVQEARERAALAWPTVAEPEPFCVCDRVGNPVGGDPRGLQLYKVEVDAGRAYVREARFSRDGFEEREAGFAARPVGAYYYDEKAATAAAWWVQARHAARSLLPLMSAVEGAE